MTSQLILSDMLGRSLQQIKSDVGEKGDLGIVAEVCVLNTILKLFMKNSITVMYYSYCIRLSVEQLEGLWC